MNPARLPFAAASVLTLVLAAASCSSGGGGGSGTCDVQEATHYDLPHVDYVGTRCNSNADCAADELCIFKNNSCVVSWGECAQKPTSCDCTPHPTCGCDGVVRESECATYAAGVALSTSGNCPAPEGQFPCGPHFCQLDTQFCRLSGTDTTDDENDAYDCQPMPASCGGSPSCDCFKGWDDCKELAPGGVVAAAYGT